MFKGLRFFYSFCWKSKKSYILLNIINQLLIGGLPLIMLSAPKFIIDELLGQQRLEYLFIYCAVLLAAMFLNMWLTQYISLQIYNQRCYVSASFGEMMHRKLVNTDLKNLEDPDFFDTKEKANKFLYGDWHGFAYVLESAFSISGKIITLLGIFAIILSLNWWMVVIFLCMIVVSTMIDSKFKIKAHSYNMEAVAVERRWNYYSRILEDVGYTKEIRINQLGDWLISKELAYAKEAIGFYKKRSKFFSFSNLSDTFCNVLQNAVAYFYLIRSFLLGSITIGSFTMYVNAVTTFSVSMKDILSSIIDIKVYGIYFNELDKYVNIPETLRDNEKKPLPQKTGYTISFKHVSFRYPGQDTYALKDISITISENEKLSIVGENGAGKTTFIKLLCRFYDPTEGAIYFNDVNIKEIDYDQYINMFSAVFQDFKLFALSLAENVIFDSEEEREKAQILLEKVGLGDKIASLPKGIDTSISKEFDADGFDPSGGEAQKIAIARALARKANIVILDEPLASLDPKAEQDIYRQFNELVAGKTAVYISHRMSASRFCDKVAVFSHGELAEYGDHNSLMARNGLYSELYHAQAQYYTDISEQDVMKSILDT